MKPKPPWSRENTIAVIAISVSIIGILLSLFNPDMRRFLRLDQPQGATSTPAFLSTQVPTIAATTVPNTRSSSTPSPASVSKVWVGTGYNTDQTLTCSIRIVFDQVPSQGYISGRYDCNGQEFVGGGNFTGNIANGKMTFQYNADRGGTAFAVFTGIINNGNAVDEGTYTVNGVYGGTWNAHAS